MEVKFSLSFFRKYFHIPNGMKLHWCVLVEKSANDEQRRLGVMLCATNKVIDVASRQFVQTDMLLMPVLYKAYPAILRKEEDEFVFTAIDGTVLRFPESYVSDLYFRSVFSEEMLFQPLI